MCCGQVFWKRVAAFGLTFGLGVFIAGLFISKKAPQTFKPFVVPAAAESKNCVPVSENLKYERLTTEEKSAAENPSEDLQLKAKKQEDKKTARKSEEQKNPAGPRPYDSSQDPAEVKNLLHKERCFETQAQ